MSGWFPIIAFLVVYVVLTQWLLPKLGVPTWRSRGSAGSRCDATKEPSSSVGQVLPAKKETGQWPTNLSLKVR